MASKEKEGTAVGFRGAPARRTPPPIGVNSATINGTESACAVVQYSIIGRRHGTAGRLDQLDWSRYFSDSASIRVFMLAPFVACAPIHLWIHMCPFIFVVVACLLQPSGWRTVMNS